MRSLSGFYLKHSIPDGTERDMKKVKSEGGTSLLIYGEMSRHRSPLNVLVTRAENAGIPSYRGAQRLSWQDIRSILYVRESCYLFCHHPAAIPLVFLV